MRAATRSSTWRRSPTSTTSSPTPPRREAVNVRGHARRCWRPRAQRGRRAGRLRQHDLGLQRLRRSAASTRRRRCRPPSHLYTATKLAGELYCKSYSELYGVDYTILRFGIPYGPRARDATVIAAFVRQGRGRRAADRRRRRQPVAALRLRRGPRRGRRRGAAARGRQPRLQPRRRRGRRRSSRSPRRCATRSADTEIVHTPAPHRRLRRQGGLERARRARSSAGRAQHAVRRGRPPLRRAGGAARAAPRRKVLILTADIGEGHDLPGARDRRRARQPSSPGVEVEVVDGLRGDGPAAHARSSATAPGSSFNWLPWLFEVQYFLLAAVPADPLAGAPARLPARGAAASAR